MDATREIIAALRQVMDPCCRERGISVVDMGLVRDVAVSDGDAQVEILLTSGWCPFQIDLLEQMEAAVKAVPGIASARVEIRVDEAWSTARLSDDARARLRFLPEPREVGHRDRYLAQHHVVVPTTRTGART